MGQTQTGAGEWGGYKHSPVGRSLKLLLGAEDDCQSGSGGVCLPHLNTIRYLTARTGSKNVLRRRVCYCTDIIVYTFTNLDGIARWLSTPPHLGYTVLYTGEPIASRTTVNKTTQCLIWLGRN